MYGLQNNREADGLVDEILAIVDNKTLLEFYHTAAPAPYSFDTCFVACTNDNHNQIWYLYVDKNGHATR